MAKIIDIADNGVEVKFLEKLRRIIQSAHLDFLIGAGCSYPALSVLGNIEKDIQTALKSEDFNQAEKIKFDFLVKHFELTQSLRDPWISDEGLETIKNYESLLDNIANILFERKSNILYKQANIFSTNYDLLIEAAAGNRDDSIILNDGFRRTSQLNKLYQYSTSEFFNVIKSTGSIYNYQFEIPIINLLKLHGSMNWEIIHDSVFQSFDHLDKADKVKTGTTIKDMEIFNNSFSLVLPQKDKFRQTVLDNTYYNLLRLYANELDKENVVLIVDGFSFADEHILEITKRGLKNPTMQLILFCYDKSAKDDAVIKFSKFNNVDIVYRATEQFSFSAFNDLLAKVIFIKPGDKNE
ncbi:MAG: SIR2 family protein [Bacteroidales bacterium]|jgi:hypothetical protein|nr:SIR2 family protein [Bacteroidales bacterium]